MKGLKCLRQLFDQVKHKNLLTSECQDLINDCEQKIDCTPFSFESFLNLATYLLKFKEKKNTSSTDSLPQSATTQSNEAQTSEQVDYSDFSEREKRILFKIQKQDKRLMQLNKAIIEMESKEIDLDALDSDETPYLIEDRLKVKFVKLYKKFALYCKKNAHLVEKLPKLHIMKQNIKFDGTSEPSYFPIKILAVLFKVFINPRHKVSRAQSGNHQKPQQYDKKQISISGLFGCIQLDQNSERKRAFGFVVS